MKIQLQNCEANLTRHCNNGCTSCNHGSPIAAKYFLPVEVLERDLKMLNEVAHFGFFCLQGGEPLLHPNIVEHMIIAKNSGIADTYGILTNGRLLGRMTDAFWAEARDMEIRVSHYPNLPREELLSYVAKGNAKGAMNIRVSNQFESFQKMFVKHADGGVEVWKQCPWRRCFTVHDGYFFHCPPAAFFPGQFPAMFNAPPAPLVDGYELATLTADAITAMLARQEPLATCAICTGGIQHGIKWSEERNRETWIEKSKV